MSDHVPSSEELFVLLASYAAERLDVVEVHSLPDTQACVHPLAHETDGGTAYVGPTIHVALLAACVGLHLIELPPNMMMVPPPELRGDPNMN